MEKPTKMKCPFELPVVAEVSVVDSSSRYITTVTHKYICGDVSSKDYTDYIVQAINSHGKFKTALRIIANGNADRMPNIAKQVLKEAENK